ncbi:unnamed protein product [Nesidiocoris tenuis]|uniref:Heparan-alpha-glucosaminide N-acetyltransferase catalytic domain-containing protein n=1 Tax=Nesidiocoris tenuis TaxID=355587 RepID=A0A6H5G9C3_9HEMI|nr:unnamed protein product [Nesidiocoris tenuis]
MKNFFSRFRCPFSFVQALNGSEALKVSTKYGTSWRLYSDHVGNFVQDQDKHAFSCEFRPRNYGQFGVYSLTSVSDGKCDITTVHPPVNIYLPLILILGTVFALAIISAIISFARIKLVARNEADADNGEKKKSNRVAAIDAFRGLCILIMIFVNDGGGHYTFFNHATWNGLHVADLLFPWFMWIMGVCIPIAIRSQLRRNITRLQIIGSIIKRSCTLFLLGLALNTVRVGADLTQIRIFGVLQRFAVVFFVVAILVTFLMISLYHPHKATMQGPFSDVANLSILWVLMFALLAGYSYLTFYFPVPGCPIGYLGPGGIHYNGIFKNCTGGVAGYIDKFLLSSRHIYQRPTASAVYLIGPYDPEGPYGCILSVLQVFFGVQAGATILSFPGWRCRLKRWLLWGVLLGVIGTILCQARQEGGWIPINKNLWSLSFVAVTSSLGFFLLSIMHYLIDVKRWWSGAPFIYPGRHSISIAIIINNNCYLCNLFILVH